MTFAGIGQMKLEHWRAVPAIFGLEAAPVLEF
mgnify:CR=1 FL=1